MKKCFVLLIAAFLVLVLGGCGVPRTSTPPAEPPRQVEQPPKVDAVVDPVAEVPNDEFEATKRKLIERGILKDTTPVYRVGEFVEAHGSNFALGRLLWFERGIDNRGHWSYRDKPSLSVFVGFRGEKKWVSGDRGNVWKHGIRLIIDDRVWTSLAGNHRNIEGGYLVDASFIYGIPDPGTHEEYILVLIRVKVPFDSPNFIPDPKDALREGDVAFIVTRQDISVFGIRGR